MLGQLSQFVENRTEWSEECPWSFSGIVITLR